MKCFLLLLAFELVTSDKLDRTYLPPPGGEFAGGSPVDLETPLEYPKAIDQGTTQDGQFLDTSQDRTITGPDNQPLDDGMPKTLAPIDYSTSSFTNNFSQSPLIPSNEYGADDATKSPLRPDNTVSYASFTPKSSSVDLSPYLTQQPYITPTTRTGLEINNIFKRPTTNEETPGYYYFVPGAELQTLRDDKTNQRPSKITSDNNLNIGQNQYPQANNGYLSGNGQSLIPKTATSEDFVQNYQPSSFGYYGGNPMIMTSQNSPPQEFGNEITSKYGQNEINFVTTSKKQGQENSNRRGSVLPFQTPLVGTNIQKSRKSSSAKIASSPKYTGRQIYPTIKQNVPITLEQRKSFPIRPKLRSERPQADTDKNAFIINYDNVLTPDGYSYSFDTSNGIHKDESGTATNGVTAKGSYSYTGDDGKFYSVTYTADENGFQPRGDHLPTPPPIPEAIMKVIEQAAKDKAVGIFDDGSYDEEKYGHINYQGAMDRYPSYKKQSVPKIAKNTDKLSRLIEGQREATVKSKIYKEANTAPVNNGEVSLTSDMKTIDDQIANQLLTNPRRKKIESRNRLPKPAERDSPVQSSNRIPLRSQQLSSRRRLPVFDVNGIQKRVLVNTGADNYNTPDTGKNTLNQDDGQIRYQKERLSPSVFRYDQNENGGKPTTNRFFQTQSPDTGYQPNSFDSKVYNQDQPNEVAQKLAFNKISLSPVTSYDNGYYYVPPKTKFQQNNQFKQDIEQPFIRKQSYAITGIPTQYDINGSVNKGTGLDSTQYPEITDENQTPTQVQFNEYNEINDLTTREPFIRGPTDQGNINFEDGTKSLAPDENKQNEITTLTNDLDSSYYVSTTTPLPPQTSQFGNQPTADGDYNINQYFQTTINPAIFGQTLPNTVENRLYIPNETPEIRVSQNVVTSTYRPDTFSDGINLEVNQNVKIYGVGRPITTDVIQAYPEEGSTFTDEFFKAAIPKEQATFTGTYPNVNIGGPTPDKILQRTNQDETFGNDYFSTESPVTGIDTGSTGYFYPNPGFGRQPDVDILVDGNLKSIGSVPNDFGLVPGEDRTSSTDTIEDQSPTERFIGEDFSGPKQPQKFDPETGYFYK